jgi:hypothetical protein
MRRQQKSVWVSSYIFPVRHGPTVTSSDHSSLQAGRKSRGMIVVVAVNNLRKGLDHEKNFFKVYKSQTSAFCSDANVFVILG